MRVIYETKNGSGEDKAAGVFCLPSFFYGSSRIEAQLNQCLSESDLVKNIIESGYDIEKVRFDVLSKLMQDEGDVIEAHELAKDGIVSQIYPLSGNEEAMGLDMLEHPTRKKEAQLAKETGQYTIAGPYELVQGGKGALLFDPIYVNGEKGEGTFWGFSILVLNGDRFLEEVEIDKLEDASYHYLIWKEGAEEGAKITVAQCIDTSVLYHSHFA